MQPQVVLMDEPFGALDALTRAHLQDSVMAIQQELGSTVIMITHDVDLLRPRDRLALAEDPRCNRLRQQVLRFLYAKHRFPQGGSRTRSGAGAPEALVAVV